MREQWRDRITWTVALGITLGLASGSIGPWITGGLVDTGQFGIQQASNMVTLEQITMGVVMIVLSGTVHLLPKRSLIAAGVILILGTQVVSYAADGVAAMGVSRILSGVGFGVVYSIAIAWGAATAMPERSFAAGQALTQVGAMFLNPLLGFGSELPGHKGVFLALELFCVVLAVPFLLLALAHPARQLVPAVAHGRRAETHAPVHRTIVAGVLTAMTLYSIGTAGLFNFLERVAGSVGLGGAKLGTGLVVGSVVGTAGSLLANRFGTRWGRLLPLCGGLVLLAGVSLWFLAVPDVWQFWVSIWLWAMLFSFVTPYVFGLAAAADPSGRVATATGTVYIIVSALGVSIAAFFVARHNTTYWGWVSLALLLITAVICAATHPRYDRIIAIEQNISTPLPKRLR